jgi:hypothetical protein
LLLLLLLLLLHRQRRRQQQFAHLLSNLLPCRLATHLVPEVGGGIFPDKSPSAAATATIAAAAAAFPHGIDD